MYPFPQICTIILAIVGSISCGDVSKKEKRGLIGLGLGSGGGHLGSGGLSLSGGLGGGSLGKLSEDYCFMLSNFLKWRNEKVLGEKCFIIKKTKYYLEIKNIFDNFSYLLRWMLKV